MLISRFADLGILHAKSWFAYLDFSTHPKMLGRIVTPFGMCGSVIVTSSIYAMTYELAISPFSFFS